MAYPRWCMFIWNLWYVVMWLRISSFNNSKTNPNFSPCLLTGCRNDCAFEYSHCGIGVNTSKGARPPFAYVENVSLNLIMFVVCNQSLFLCGSLLSLRRFLYLLYLLYPFRRGLNMNRREIWSNIERELLGLKGGWKHDQAVEPPKESSRLAGDCLMSIY